MARDDAHVLIYKILTYLYKQLKDDEPIDPDKISADGLNIREGYWCWIMRQLINAKYTTGYSVVSNGPDRVRIDHLKRATITYKGVEYLFSDTFMAKVRELYPEIK